MYAFVLKYWCINNDSGKILFLEFLQKKTELYTMYEFSQP